MRDLAVLAGLVACAGVFGSPAQASEASLIRVEAAGASRTVERGPGRSLVVTYVDGETSERQTIDLVSVAPGSQPVEVRAVLLPNDVLALVIVARRDEESWRTYHWARDRAGPGKARSEWTVSKPLFQSSGGAFRIVELRHKGAGIEATFRRGEADPASPDTPVTIEEKVYANADLGDPEVRYDRPGEILVEGTLRRDPPAAVAMSIGADGAVRMVVPGGATISGSLAGDIEAIRDALARLATSGGPSDRQRRNVLDLTVSPEARWQWVAWSAQAVIGPWGIDRLRFLGEGADPIVLPLPSDGPAGESTPPKGPPSIEVGLGRSEGTTRVRSDGVDLSLPVGEPDEARRYAATEPLRVRLKEKQRVQGPSVVVVSTPPPRGAEVPAGDVLLILRAVQETSPSTVHLGGSAPPGGFSRPKEPSTR